MNTFEYNSHITKYNIITDDEHFFHNWRRDQRKPGGLTKWIVRHNLIFGRDDPCDLVFGGVDSSSTSVNSALQEVNTALDEVNSSMDGLTWGTGWLQDGLTWGRVSLGTTKNANTVCLLPGTYLYLNPCCYKCRKHNQRPDRKTHK